MREYEVKIRTEKWGVYHDHGPFTIAAKSKQSAITKALGHLSIRIRRLYMNPNPAKVAAFKNIMEDTVGSEYSVICRRLS